MIRFLLLGSGRIAERFLQDARFDASLQGLVGVVGAGSVLAALGPRGDALPSRAVVEIGPKDECLRRIAALIEEYKPELVLSVQFPWILPGDIIAAVGGRVLNMHNARLPEYRGHNAISYEILNGEETHTSTLHWVAEEVDRGRVVRTRTIPIEPHDTAFSLWSRSAESALALLADFFSSVPSADALPVGEPVPDGGAYYRRDVSRVKRIPDGASLEDIDRWARAFWFPPHEPAYLMNGERRLYVLPGTWDYGRP